MRREIKIFGQANNSPANVGFDDLCYLVERVGFVFERQAGTSHRIYKHPEIKDVFDSMINIQRQPDGKALKKQVRVVLGVIERYDLLEKKGDLDEKD